MGKIPKFLQLAYGFFVQNVERPVRSCPAAQLFSAQAQLLLQLIYMQLQLQYAVPTQPGLHNIVYITWRYVNLKVKKLIN